MRLFRIEHAFCLRATSYYAPKKRAKFDAQRMCAIEETSRSALERARCSIVHRGSVVRCARVACANVFCACS